MPVMPEVLRVGREVLASDAFHEHLMASLLHWGVGVGCGVLVASLITAVLCAGRPDGIVSIGVSAVAGARGLTVVAPIALGLHGGEVAWWCLVALVTAVPLATSATAGARRLGRLLVEPPTGAGRPGVQRAAPTRRAASEVVPSVLRGLRVGLVGAWLVVGVGEVVEGDAGLGTLAASSLVSGRVADLLTSVCAASILVWCSAAVPAAADCVLVTRLPATSPTRRTTAVDRL